MRLKLILKDLQLAKRFIESIAHRTFEDIKERSWDEY